MPSNRKNSWPAERDALLRELWAQGLSGSQIARRPEFKLTRNAVIGRANRLGLEARRGGLNQTSGRKKSDRCRPFKARKKTAPPPRGAVAGGRLASPDNNVPLHPSFDPPLEERMSITAIKRRQCHFPLGEPTMFCGRPTCDRGSGAWCAHHADRVYAGLPKPPMRPASRHLINQLGKVK